MPYTHDDLVRIEWVAGRVMRACRQFADAETARALADAEYILAAVRSAGQFLADGSYATHSERESVTESLLSNLYGSNKP